MIKTGLALLSGTRCSLAPLRFAPPRFTPLRLGIVIGLLSMACPILGQVLPSGFQKEQIVGQLSKPVSVQFAADGRVFVAEKAGRILVFDSLSDTTPEVFADLRIQVFSRWDRGLLAMALDPDFPASPFLYISYVFDGVVDQETNEQQGYAPKWGTIPPTDADRCPDPPGATGTPGGCVVSGRVSRLEAAGNRMLEGSERVLVQDYFQQYPSHSVGGLAFGSDGALYVGGGDGASFSVVDHGQYGSTPPAGFPAEVFPDDPPLEGGAVRSQDLETEGDAVGLSGTVIRVDPATGQAASGNPLAGHDDFNARKIVAYGLRNPYSMAVRPGTNEVWVGDVGWGQWEEINRIIDPGVAAINFGWPCYSGALRQNAYKNVGLPVCEELYALDEGQPSQAVRQHTLPFYSYHHNESIGPEEGNLCPTVGTSSITALAFYPGGAYPASYDNALFFADYSRQCLYVSLDSDLDGLPDQPMGFESGSAIVYLTRGPGGDLFYVEHVEGAIYRIRYGDNQQPTARITLAPGSSSSGVAPLQIAFDAAFSSDPEEDTLSYAWDLDGDGDFDDSTSVRPTRTYDEPSTIVVGLRVIDVAGNSDTDTLEIAVSNSPPTARINSPLESFRWQANQQVAYAGSATDLQDGDLSGSDFVWDLLLHHCDLSGHCHAHFLFEGADGAEGQFQAPDHELPAWLELIMTATDSLGASESTSVELQPLAGTLTIQSLPTGISLAVGSAESRPTPFERQAVLGGTISVIAPPIVVHAGTEYGFWSWSDGGDRLHDLTTTGDLTLTAEFRKTMDLALVVEGPPPSAVGELVRYGIFLSNQGANAATHPAVHVALPKNLEFVSARGQGWSCTAGGVVQCGAMALQPLQSSGELILTLRAMTSGDVFSTVRAFRGSEVDVNGDNDVVLVLNQIAAEPPLFRDRFESGDLTAWASQP